MVYAIGCVDDGSRYEIKSKTGYAAMMKLIKALNSAKYDSFTAIRKTPTGEHLYCIHQGKTYIVNINGKKRRN